MKQNPIVVIDAGYCKGCEICIHFCPKHILELAPEVNRLGYHPPVVTNENECNGCCQCELFCPDFAIFIIEGDKRGD
ncbi:MAG: 4Fe-4S dicluster domain-containing protein [Planctomycetota bacterium]|jgi:2-oxoglutarate ferredoxin oxidoreductase subunit delta